MTALDINTSTENIPFWQSHRFQRTVSMGIRYVIALLLVLFAVLPALWVISSSLNPAKSLVGGTLSPKTRASQTICNCWITSSSPMRNGC